MGAITTAPAHRVIPAGRARTTSGEPKGRPQACSGKRLSQHRALSEEATCGRPQPQGQPAEYQANHPVELPNSLPDGADWAGLGGRGLLANPVLRWMAQEPLC